MIEVMQKAITQSAADYFLWSRGRLTHDRGVEQIMCVYMAKLLQAEVGSDPDGVIDLELPTRELPFRDCLPEGFRHGRIDLFFRHDQALNFVEAKRYLNIGSVVADLTRISELVRSAELSGYEASGFLVGPMYRYVGQDYCFQAHYQAQLATVTHLFTGAELHVHVSQEVSLPGPYTHRGIDRIIGVVVHVKPVAQ